MSNTRVKCICRWKTVTIPDAACKSQTGGDSQCEAEAQCVRTLCSEWMEKAHKDLDTLFSFILCTQSCTELLGTEQMISETPQPCSLGPARLRRTVLLQHCQYPQHFPVLSSFTLFLTLHQTDREQDNFAQTPPVKGRVLKLAVQWWFLLSPVEEHLNISGTSKVWVWSAVCSSCRFTAPHEQFRGNVVIFLCFAGRTQPTAPVGCCECYWKVGVHVSDSLVQTAWRGEQVRKWVLWVTPAGRRCCEEQSCTESGTGQSVLLPVTVWGCPELVLAAT